MHTTHEPSSPSIFPGLAPCHPIFPPFPRSGPNTSRFILHAPMCAPGEQQTKDGPIPIWRIVDIISHTDVIRFLAGKVDALDPAFDASLQELGLVNGVEMVTADLPAISGAVHSRIPILVVFFYFTVADLQICLSPIKTHVLTSLAAAFAFMHRKGLSGVGVTDEEGGPLISNLSVSDLRGLTVERWVWNVHREGVDAMGKKMISF